MATPAVEMTLEIVGTAVPVATFHVFTVQVPVSTDILYPTIVAAKGQVKYPFVFPVDIALPPPSTVKPCASRISSAILASAAERF